MVGLGFLCDLNKDNVLEFIIYDIERWRSNGFNTSLWLYKPKEQQSRTSINILTVNGYDGRIIWNKTLDDFSHIGLLTDVTGDGGDEILWSLIEPTLSQVNISVLKSENGNFLWKNSYELFSKNSSVYVHNVYDDYTDDGKSDILIEINDYDPTKDIIKLRVQCINGVTGKSFWFKDFAVNITGNPLFPYPQIIVGGDLNNDKTNDTVIFAYDYTKSFICALDGKDGKQLWNISAPPHGRLHVSIHTLRPQAIFDDFTGDNKIDVAYPLRDISGNKCNVTVRDGYTGKLILVREVNKSIFFTQMKNYHYKFIELPDDYTGDNIPDLIYYNPMDGVTLLDPTTNKTVWNTIWSKGGLLLAPMRCEVDNDKINDFLVWEYISTSTQNLILVSGKTGKDIWKIDHIGDMDSSFQWVYFMNRVEKDFSDMDKDKIPDVVVPLNPIVEQGNNVTIKYVCYNGRSSKELWKNKYTFDVGPNVNKYVLLVTCTHAGDLTWEGNNDVDLRVGGISDDKTYFKGWSHVLCGELSGAYLGTIYTNLTSEQPVLPHFVTWSVKVLAYSSGFRKGYELNKDGIDNDFLVWTKKGFYIFITPPIDEYSILFIPLIAPIAIFLFISIKKEKRIK